LEVATIIAREMTNPWIATQLVIAEGTAANHVTHILARLTLDLWIQIATWAIEHGLPVSSRS
jgi:DNA-binding NarL/FixJ family response regulator